MIVVSALNFQPEGRWFEAGHCCRVVSLDKNFAPRFLSVLRSCINEYRRHNAGGGGGVGGVTLRWTGISSKWGGGGGSSNTLSRFMSQNPG